MPRTGVTRADLPATQAASITGVIGRQTTADTTKGAIDEVAVYGAALGAGDVAAHYELR